MSVDGTCLTGAELLRVTEHKVSTGPSPQAGSVGSSLLFLFFLLLLLLLMMINMLTVLLFSTLSPRDVTVIAPLKQKVAEWGITVKQGAAEVKTHK